MPTMAEPPRWQTVHPSEWTDEDCDAYLAHTHTAEEIDPAAIAAAARILGSAPGQPAPPPIGLDPPALVAARDRAARAASTPLRSAPPGP